MKEHRTAFVGPSPSDIDQEWDSRPNEDDRIHNRLQELAELMAACADVDDVQITKSQLDRQLRSISPSVGLATLQKHLFWKSCRIELDEATNGWLVKRVPHPRRPLVNEALRAMVVVGLLPTVGCHMSAGRILERANDIATGITGAFDLLPVVKEVP